MGREEKDKRGDNKRIKETNVEYLWSHRQSRYRRNVKWFEEVKEREN